MKYLLKFSAIESVLVMNLLPKLILFGNFYRREEFLPIIFASFIADHVIFILFLYFIINWRNEVFSHVFSSAQINFYNFCMHFPLFLHLVFKNFSYKRCLCFGDFFIPVVIRRLCMSLVFSFIILIAKYSS